MISSSDSPVYAVHVSEMAVFNSSLLRSSSSALLEIQSIVEFSFGSDFPLLPPPPEPLLTLGLVDFGPVYPFTGAISASKFFSKLVAVFWICFSAKLDITRLYFAPLCNVPSAL